MSSLWQTLKSTLGAGSTPPRARRRPAVAPRSPYRACTIIPGPSACDAVKKLRDKRILQAEVPLVPLPDCDRLSCDCRYRRYEDRRNPNQERRLWGTEEQRLWGTEATRLYHHMATERRQQAFGRRADDHKH